MDFYRVQSQNINPIGFELGVNAMASGSSDRLAAALPNINHHDRNYTNPISYYFHQAKFSRTEGSFRSALWYNPDCRSTINDVTDSDLC